MKASVAFLGVAFAAGAVHVAFHAAPLSARTGNPHHIQANTVWIDSLDLSQVVGTAGPPRAGQPMLGRGRGNGGGRGGRAAGAGGAPATPPPPPPPIKLAGNSYTHGLGVTSGAELWIDLKGHAKTFTSTVGIDDSAKAQHGAVRFKVYVDDKKAFDSDVINAGDPPKQVAVDLSGKKVLMLYVENAGKGADAANVADWADASIAMTSADKPVATQPIEAPPAISMGIGPEPRINSPRITGATPGKPFEFQIPASGQAPLNYTAKNLPPGVSLDSKTGVISGSLKENGSTVVAVTVTGPKGKATGDITIVGGQRKLALTPPMGWNSWNVWGATVTDAKVRAAADAMVSSGLAAQGYTYVNIDDAWEGRQRDPQGNITGNEKFPDMKALTDYVHAKGLKIGLYSGPGEFTCQRYPASWQHEAQDVHTWTTWGFDYIKYDWCSYSTQEPDRNNLAGLKKPYELLRGILDTASRDMVMSMCQYGWGNVWEWGGDLGGNLWRATGDIRDTWQSMSSIGFIASGHEKYAGPGHWNDVDMLVVGKLGWGATPRDSKLTKNEQMTHIALWSLQAAPLIIGADLSQIDAFTTAVLGNPEVLAVDQDPLGHAAGRISQTGPVEVWARPLLDGTMAVGLFNRDPVPEEVTVKYSDLNLTGSQPVRNLWLRKDLGNAKDSFTAEVPRHGVVLVKIGKPTAH